MPVDLHVVTPQREVWAGDAEMVIARGVDGEVGILGGHAPLVLEHLRDEGERIHRQPVRRRW